MRVQMGIKEDYLLIKPQHYFNEEIAGDFTPIIQRDKFLKQNYSISSD